MNTVRLVPTVLAVVVLLAFGVFWGGMVGFMDYSFGKQIAGQFVSAKYPSTTGRVMQSEMSVYHGSKSTSYRWNLRYRYNAGGQELEGGRYRYSTTTSTHPVAVSDANYGWVQELVAEHPVGSPVRVFYNPRNPQDALLAPGVDGSDLMLVLFITPFNFVAVAIGVAVFSMARRLFASPVAGGVRIIRDGFRVRVRLPVFTPVMLGLLVTGGLAFLGIFALAISFNSRPPLSLTVAAIALAYGAGLAAAMVQWSKIAAGKDDLVIDEGLRSLQLPMTYGRKECRAVGFAEVASVEVETIVNTNSKGGTTYSYAPTLYLRDGAAKGERLASWNNSRQAKAFAQWLREQLQLTQQGTESE